MAETDTRFRVEGMDCAACAARVEAAARRVPGVETVSVSVVAGTMSVRHAAGTDLAQLARRIGEAGYGAVPIGNVASPAPADRGDHGHNEAEDDDHHEPAAPADGLAGLHGHDHGPADGPWWATAKARLTLLCALAVAAAFGLAALLPAQAGWIFTAAMLVGLVPIARRAIVGALNGVPFTIETLMSVAAIGAVAIGASEEAAVVVILFLVGELLESIATGRARAGIRALAALVPRTALLEADGTTRTVPAEALAVDSIILVRPGDRVAADGLVVAGDSAVDEAPVTGESVPRAKAAGDSVYAGTINQQGTLRVRVTAAAADNTIARIVRLVEEAQESKAPTERFIERFARWYTPAVMVVAALVAVVPPLLTGAGWGEWVYKGLAVLLIGCPCALVISTPAAIAAALSAGARLGLLMKGGAVLETLGKVDRVAFDKTGTLTEGKPRVTDVIAAALDEAGVIRLAAALEAGSSHPLAHAILAEAARRGIAAGVAEGGAAIGGKGVTGRFEQHELFLGSPAAVDGLAPMPAELIARIAALNDAGKTVSVLVADGAVAGAIAMRDQPRADARTGIEALRRAGIEAIMLTGDNARTAAAIAADLGITARADLLPEDKQRIVGDLMQAGRVVAKVGDGINDAPALAAADVGIAMGGGTDVALETADAAVLHGRVLDVARMVALSRAATRNIAQNITIALGLKAVFLVTTVLGVTGLWPAILADTGATVLVTANAMRLLAWRGDGQRRQ